MFVLISKQQILRIAVILAVVVVGLALLFFAAIQYGTAMTGRLDLRTTIVFERPVSATEAQRFLANNELKPWSFTVNGPGFAVGAKVEDIEGLSGLVNKIAQPVSLMQYEYLIDEIDVVGNVRRRVADHPLVSSTRVYSGNDSLPYRLLNWIIR